MVYISRRLDWLLPAWLEDAGAFDQLVDEDLSSGKHLIFNVNKFYNKLLL